MIQYIYAKYGRERAFAATVIRYRPKSAPGTAARRSAWNWPRWSGWQRRFPGGTGARTCLERLREAGFDPESPTVLRLLALVEALLGFPRHLSQHVGGFVISRGLLSRLVPIENAAMAERSVIQWDKDDLDALGCRSGCSRSACSAIRRCLDLVARFRGRPLAMQDNPPEAPAVYAMMQRADTIGVFQIESRAQMSMLPRLKPANFYDLVIEVAIVRPGPIQGGMVHPYLRRRQELEPVSYPSDAVKGVLERTLGIPIFQEQVISSVAAGFTRGKPITAPLDAAWKGRAAWAFRAAPDHCKRARGYAREFAERIYQQISASANTVFPNRIGELRLLVCGVRLAQRHHPAAFLAALLNSQPMDFYAPSQLNRMRAATASRCGRWTC